MSKIGYIDRRIFLRGVCAGFVIGLANLDYKTTLISTAALIAMEGTFKYLTKPKRTGFFVLNVVAGVNHEIKLIIFHCIATVGVSLLAANNLTLHNRFFMGISAASITTFRH